MYKQLDLFASLVEEPPATLPQKPITDAHVIDGPAPDAGLPEEPRGSLSGDEPDFPVLERKTGISAKKGKRGRKSIREMDAESDLINVPDDEILFRKQYYSIGEVADMFNLNTSLLRYWETEFDILKPRKNRKGDRHFRPEDIKNLRLIHHLLRKRKYTIEGAKSYLKKNKATAGPNFDIIQRLEKLKGFLLELRAGL